MFNLQKCSSQALCTTDESQLTLLLPFLLSRLDPWIGEGMLNNTHESQKVSNAILTFKLFFQFVPYIGTVLFPFLRIATIHNNLRHDAKPIYLLHTFSIMKCVDILHPFAWTLECAISVCLWRPIRKRNLRKGIEKSEAISTVFFARAEPSTIYVTTRYITVFSRE